MDVEGDFDAGDGNCVGMQDGSQWKNHQAGVDASSVMCTCKVHSRVNGCNGYMQLQQRGGRVVLASGQEVATRC